MKMRVIKPLPGVAMTLKEGDVVQADPCKHVKGAYNCMKDGVTIGWAIPAEYLEEVK